MTEREAVVAFLQEEADKHAKAARGDAADVSPDAVARLNSKAFVLRTMVAYIDRGDHLIGRGIIDQVCPMCGHKERVQ